MQVRTKLDRYGVVIAEPPKESLGIMFEAYTGAQAYPYAMQVEDVVAGSMASDFGTIAARDVLVAINGEQLATKTFAEVATILRAALDPEADWPCKLQFLQHKVHYDVQLSTSGSLGLVLQVVRDGGQYAIEVDKIVEGAAAEATRIVPTDVLTAINDEALVNLNFDECAAVLTREKGKEGAEKIKLCFLHKNNTPRPKASLVRQTCH